MPDNYVRCKGAFIGNNSIVQCPVLIFRLVHIILISTSWPLDWVHYECRFKVKGRVKRLLNNEIGLHIFVKNINNISTVKHFLENHVHAIKSKHKHKHNVKLHLWIDEQCVQDIVSLVDEWKCNPFDPENQNLQTLQTGAYASEELVNNFESPYKDGDTPIPN